MILRNEKCDNSYHRASFTLWLCQTATNWCVNKILWLWCSIPPNKTEWKVLVVGVSMHAMTCVCVCRAMRRKTIRQSLSDKQLTANMVFRKELEKHRRELKFSSAAPKPNKFTAIEMHRSEPATECYRNRKQWKEKRNWWSNGRLMADVIKIGAAENWFRYEFLFTLHFVAARNKLRISRNSAIVRGSESHCQTSNCSSLFEYVCQSESRNAEFFGWYANYMGAVLHVTANQVQIFEENNNHNAMQS